MHAVLFDLDGTLIDTAPDLALAINAIREQEGLAPLAFNEIRQIVSDGAKAMVKLGFNVEHNDARYPQYRERLLQHYQENIHIRTCLFPGISSFLAYCKSNQIPWGIVTNKPKPLTDKLLHSMQLNHSSAVTICPEDVTKQKPDPEGLLKACQTLNTNPEKTLYVGDHLRDIQAAKAACMPSVAVTYGYIKTPSQASSWGADFIIDHPESLTDLI